MAWVQPAVLEGRTLTARERQVVSMLGDGQTRKEVAFALGIADSTVRVLNSRAMKKVERRGASYDLLNGANNSSGKRLALTGNSANHAPSGRACVLLLSVGNGAGNSRRR